MKRTTFEIMEELKDDYENMKVFPFYQNGASYSANHKKGVPARISIALPSDIVDDDLKELDNWMFRVIAFRKSKLDEMGKEEDSEQTE